MNADVGSFDSAPIPRFPQRATDSWGRGIPRSPLLLIAGLFFLGIGLDRWLIPPPEVVAALFSGAVVACLFTQMTGSFRLALFYLGFCVLVAGMLRHSLAVRVPADNDIVHVLGESPLGIQLRGRVESEPRFLPPESNELRSRPAEPVTRMEVRIQAVRQGGDWQSAEGNVRLYLAGTAPELCLGDRLEATGLLVRLPAAANPGEIDRAAYLGERGIRGTFHVSSLPGSWQRLESAWYLSAEGLLAVLRGQGQATLLRFLPSETGPLASTLLLGEGAPLDREAWEQYLRTGIVAVLAISGQHLVILGGFLEVLGRCLGCGLRMRSAVIAVLLLGYALLTGGRPPAVRAAVVVVLYALAIGLRRPARAVNLLALAWLLIGVLDPADLFSPGCQFSFLAVAVLTALPVTWPGEPDDPLNRLVESSDPIVRQVLRDVARLVVRVYVGSALLWLTLAPLTLWHYHLLSPVAVLLAPVLTVLATLALLVGFLLLAVGPILPVLAPVLVVPLDGILRAMQVLIELGDRCPGGWFYLPTVNSVAVVAFYLGLLMVLALPWVRWRWRLLVPGMSLWLVLVLLWPFRVSPGDELRATFLAVGHGSSVVLELPDGRVLLYDAGSLRGPGITAQVIAPYLWERGIGRIDEVFLSHADLDHFNGLPALLDRFPVGRVSTTPSFAEKPSPAVLATLRHLEQRGIPIRRLHAGMKLQAGETEIEVLHPPSVGPTGAENLRSLVLRVSLQERSLLLTGDLEQAGLERVLRLEPRRAEVLMYPHHGSKRVDPVPLVRWAGAKWLIACQGATTNRSDPARELPQDVRWLNTHQAGAIFCRGTRSGWEVQTFREGASR